MFGNGISLSEVLIGIRLDKNIPGARDLSTEILNVLPSDQVSAISTVDGAKVNEDFTCGFENNTIIGGHIGTIANIERIVKGIREIYHHLSEPSTPHVDEG